MSAWLCTDNHLSLIANAGGGTEAEKDVAFALLLNENIRSLNARYPHCVLEHAADAVDAVRRDAPVDELVREALASNTRPRCFGRKVTHKVITTQIVKACDCYDYQACETDDYKTTNASELVHLIRKRAIELGGETEGRLYDALLWGID